MKRNIHLTFLTLVIMMSLPLTQSFAASSKSTKKIPTVISGPSQSYAVSNLRAAVAMLDEKVRKRTVDYNRESTDQSIPGQTITGPFH